MVDESSHLNLYKASHSRTNVIGEIAGNIYDCCILVVDDDLSCNYISQLLLKEGFYNLHFAYKGEEALIKAAGLQPDLIILEEQMSTMHGAEICQKMRNDDKIGDIPIIIHTAQSSPEDRARIFDAGATDILLKPVTESEIKSRVNLHLEFRILVKGLKDYHARLTRDLEMARTMQYALLPDDEVLETISHKYGIDIAYAYETSDELGGDFWGIDVLDENRIFIYVTDFSGHGVSAALNTFRLHSLMTQYDDVVSPAEYLEKLNRILFKLLPVEQYASMLCGIIDVKKDMFSYAAAASTAPVHFLKNSLDMKLLDSSGFPLGIREDATYEVRQVPFRKGEMLFLYSDVLTESMDQLGRMIGEEKFQTMCVDSCQHTSGKDKFLDRFMQLFNMHVVRPLQDDLTAMTLIRR